MKPSEFKQLQKDGWAIVRSGLDLAEADDKPSPAPTAKPSAPAKPAVQPKLPTPDPSRDVKPAATPASKEPPPAVPPSDAKLDAVKKLHKMADKTFKSLDDMAVFANEMGLKDVAAMIGKVEDAFWEMKRNLAKIRESREAVLEAADVLDLKPQLKQKKQQDMQPDFSKAEMRVSTSSSYGRGYELSVTVPVSADFLKSKQGGMGIFVHHLHDYINHQIGKWMGQPTIGQDKRAKNGMLGVTATWHFTDAAFAYGLGLDLTQHSGGAKVNPKDLHHRMQQADVAFNELDGFKKRAQGELKNLDPAARDAAWKSDYMPDFLKLSDQWKKKGISYMALKDGR